LSCADAGVRRTQSGGMAAKGEAPASSAICFVAQNASVSKMDPTFAAGQIVIPP
jgi:hypothetical protein